MDRTVARQRLERMTAASSDPTLTEDELGELLADAARPDTGSRLPDDDQWEPTYDLNSAAAAGWELKAGKAAADYDFSRDGASHARSQVQKMCLAQAALYRGKAQGGAGLGMIEVAAPGPTLALGPNQVANL